MNQRVCLLTLTISGQLIMTPVKRSVIRVCDNPINANYRYILIITQLKRADNSISHLIISTYLRARLTKKNDSIVQSKIIASLEQQI